MGARKRRETEAKVVVLHPPSRDRARFEKHPPISGDRRRGRLQKEVLREVTRTHSSLILWLLLVVEADEVFPRSPQLVAREWEHIQLTILEVLCAVASKTTAGHNTLQGSHCIR